VKNAKKSQKGIAKWFIMMYNKDVLKTVPIVQNVIWHDKRKGRAYYDNVIFF